MNPNDLIQTISAKIDQAEVNHDPYSLMEARRILNNELPQAIDQYVEAQVQQAVEAYANRPYILSKQYDHDLASAD